jgi:hypothetical protein
MFNIIGYRYIHGETTYMERRGGSSRNCGLNHSSFETRNLAGIRYEKLYGAIFS